MPPPQTTTRTTPPPKTASPELAPTPLLFLGAFVGFMAISIFSERLFRTRIPKDWADPAPLPKDGKLGDYQLGPMLADGGTATVYSGRDDTHQPVAIKIPHRGPLRIHSFVVNFEREAQIGVDLRHPSIVKVLKAGNYRAAPFRRIPYFIMEFLEGQELDAILAQGTLSEKEAIGVGRGVADALQWAHARGVIHRDISPRNIFITNRRAVKVMDFGISTVNQRGPRGRPSRGLAYGTPDYMSPERLTDSRTADERGDLYALGCVLYEMLTGEPPFRAETPEKTALRHRKDPIPSLYERGLASKKFDDIVGKLLAKSPKERFQTAGEVTARLADLLPHV